MDLPAACTCPFCPFSDHDSYFLMQHVELCHPENGESPFIATQAKVVPRPFPEDGSGSASTTDVPSEDDEEYVECPHRCGEAVTVTELPNHMELHQDEGMAFDEAEPHQRDGAIYLHGGKAPLPGLQNQFSVDLPDALRNCTAKPAPGTTLERRPRHIKHKEYRGGSSWKDFLWGTSSTSTSSSSSKPRSKTAKAKHATVKRLGVCAKLHIFRRRREPKVLIVNRKTNWGLMPTKNRCRYGFACSSSVVPRSL